MDYENAFNQWKKRCFSKVDISKKGSIDDDIYHIVSLINVSSNYFTTSSCSGRIILVEGVRNISYFAAKQNDRSLLLTDSHFLCKAFRELQSTEAEYLLVVCIAPEM